MSLKLKIILSILFIILIAGAAGFLYFVDVSKFDNKKQYKIAENFYKEKNYQEAYATFLKIRHYSKYRQISLLKQALAAEKLADWSVAMNKYEAFLKNTETDNSFKARAEYSYAKSCFMAKEYDTATETFLNIKKTSPIQDYKYAADYFLGKISLEKNLAPTAKKYYISYLKNAPTGTYSLSIATDLLKNTLNNDEAILVAKIFLANQKYDDALTVLKKIPDEKSWIYKSIAEYYKNNNAKFKQYSNDGLKKECRFFDKEDLINYMDFYLSMQKDYKNAVTALQKTPVNKSIPDYFLYKLAQFEQQEEKIKLYKELVKKYPASSYVPDCLIDIFFDFGDKKQYHSAVRVGEIYLQKFPDKIDVPQILFWTGKYLLKLKRYDDAKLYYDKLLAKYPSSYYAFRASRADRNDKTSWIFEKKPLPDSFNTDFPMKTVKAEDAEMVKLFLEVEDYTIWDEIPFENNAIRAWLEHKRGNIQKSVYLANKYILDSKEKIPYDVSVWNFAFPIYYSEDINLHSQMRNLDAFLMLSLIREESHFNPKARSSSNAVGLMQLMLPTAENIAEKTGKEPPTDNNLQDYRYNITLGTAYFSFVMDMTDNFPMYAVGGYNGGFNAMNSWRKKHEGLDTDEFVEKIPYPESKNYIKKVYRSRYNYDKIYGR